MSESNVATIERAQAEIPAPNLNLSVPASSRMVSLDVFRGMTVAAMILVNNSGGRSYAPLEHAEWHGWTHTDLIFPFFLFIAGVSMALSFSRRVEKGDTRRALLLHTVKRGVIIFAIGLWLNLFPYFFDAARYQNLRIPGVLQRIGFCYIFAGAAYLLLSKRARFAFIVTALLGYWAAMTLIPVPGIGAGDLSPNNNLAAYIDNAIFSAKHMWQHRPWDPEGLLSSIPAICTLLIGTFVGEWMLSLPTWQDKIKRLVAVGLAFIIVGELWSLVFPINKSLWTSSYVIFTAGYAMLLLAACYWLIDIRGFRAWGKPFLFFGMNAILAFTLSTFVAKNLLIYRVQTAKGSTSAYSWIAQHWFRPYFADPRNASLAFALTYASIWMLLMWWLHEKKIFLKI
ncbi:MAG: N-acetylglucosamine related transporter, NagX [Acidobacteriales bacterium]|nr:N-acetylglucosamine related transporter, NagX [Terriglobales bacterium]